MRVRGFLSSRFKPPAPLVEALINLPAIGERHIVLLIDTGSSTTTILDSDAGRFGITMDYARKHLKPAKLESAVKRMEEKYGATFEEFEEGDMLSKLGHSWEVEQDYYDWDRAVTELKKFREILKSLE